MSDNLNFTDLDYAKLEPIVQFYYCIRIAMLGIRVGKKLISYENNSLNNKGD